MVGSRPSLRWESWPTWSRPASTRTGQLFATITGIRVCGTATRSLIRLVALWGLYHIRLSQYGFCPLTWFVALWRLSLIRFVALLLLSRIRVVPLLGLSHHEVCHIRRVFAYYDFRIIGFVAL